jgi:xylan 1,4-beta-xylosidase
MMAGKENGRVASPPCFPQWRSERARTLAGSDAAVSIELAGLPKEAKRARTPRHLIDKTHSNAYTLWQQMGSPADPTPEQYGKLESAGRLAEAEAPKLARDADGKASVSFALPRQAVTLLTVEW